MRRADMALLCLAIAKLGVPPRAYCDEGSPTLSGSLRCASGYVSYRDGIPDTATRDWYGLSTASARLSQHGERTGFHTELWTQFDAATGSWAISLDEAWAELRPAPFLDLRLGRSPLLFGPCIAFSPANGFVARDSFDARAGKVGLDGVSMELRPLAMGGEQDDLVSVLVNTAFILPGGSTDSPAAYDIDESSAHARLTLYAPAIGIAGTTELGVSGDARRLGGTAPEGEIPVSAGAWLSADIAGFVLGAEGGIRSRSYEELSALGATAPPETTTGAEGEPQYRLALSLNRRLGDFFAIVETEYNHTGGFWRGFAQLSWATGDFNATAAGLMDFETCAARTALDFAWNASDFLVLRAIGGWNYHPAEWKTALPVDYSAGLAFECYY